MISRQCPVLVLFVFSLSFSIVKSCQNKTIHIRKPIGNLTLSYCQMTKKIIPVDAYFDNKSNTSVLDIQLLDSDGSPLQTSSHFAQLNIKLRTLYVIPLPQVKTDDLNYKPTNQIKKYVLRITNNQTGDCVDDVMYITVNGNVPNRNWEITVNAFISSSNRAESDVENLYRFAEKVYNKSRRNVLNGSDIYFYHQYFIQRNGGIEMKVSYQNCTLRENQCDFSAIRDVKLLHDFYNTQLIGEEFRKYMLPDYEITDIGYSYKPPCDARLENLRPSIGNILSIYNYLMGIDLKKYPGLDELIFLQKDFNSEIITDTIRVELFEHTSNEEISHSIIPKSSFVNIWYNQENKTHPYVLNIVLTDDAYKTASNSSGNSLMYDVRVSDQLNRMSKYVFKYNVPEPPISFYVLSFQFSNFQLSQNDYMTYHMTKFMRTLSNALGLYNGISFKNLINLKTLLFTSKDINKDIATGTAIWSVNVSHLCNYNLIKAIQTKMFISVTDKRVNQQFIDALSTLFDIDTITEEFNKPCSNSPPTVNRLIPALEIPTCGLYSFELPENTFYDAEDGNTRNLHITLHDKDGNLITGSSWLQFDSKKQTYYALVPTDISKQEKFEFTMKATDTTGLSVCTPVLAYIYGNNEPTSYRVTIRGNYVGYQTTESLNPAHVVAKRVGNFLNDFTGFQLLTNALTSSGEQFIEFTNCNFRKYPCDSVAVGAFSSKMFNVNDVVKKEFLNIFNPEFSEPIITGEVDGPCKINERPTVPHPWGPLNVDPCETFRQIVPSETFNDTEQGNTRNLRLTFTLQSATVNNELPIWVNFNTTTQELSILASYGLQPNYLFLLSAFDVNDLSAVQNLQINIQSNPKPPSHEFSMTLTVSSYSSVEGFIPFYDTLRKKVQNYFGDSHSTMLYIEISNYPSTKYVVKWTNCSVSTIKCEKSKIDYVKDRMLDNNGKISIFFINSLQPQFRVESLEFKESGICVDEKKLPVVQMLIPDQAVSYCAYLKYIIPENTFKDILDGNTRQMKLSLFNDDWSPLSPDDWISFNEKTQELLIVLQSSKPVARQLYTFHLKATNSRSLSVTTPIVVKIIGEKTPLRFNIKINAKVNYVPYSSTETFAKFIEQISKVYQTASKNLHIFEGIFNSDSSILSATVINCNCTNEFIQNNYTELKAYDFSLLGTEFTSLLVDSRSGVPCGIPAAPIVLYKPSEFDIYRCSSFTKEILNLFKDESGEKYLVYTLQNQNIFAGTDWLTFDGKQFHGVVTNDVLINRPSSNKYNITIRATNRFNLFAETWVLINVVGDVPQRFYTYMMTVADNYGQIVNSGSQLARMIETSLKVNNYFNSSVMNILSYHIDQTNIFTIHWSICSLPNRCTLLGSSEYTNKMYDDGKPKQIFKNAFETTLSYVSLFEENLDVCKKPLNPPSPKENPLKIIVHFCGGMQYVIPLELFNDPEDGNTRNLSLYLKTSTGKDVVEYYPWLYFNEGTHTVYIVPTYDQALSYIKSEQILELTAKDSSGLTSTINVYLEIEIPTAPKYWHIFIMSSLDEQNVSDRFLFMNKIAELQGDKDRYSIGIKQISTNRIDIFNCSVRVNPCDLFLFEQIQASYATKTDLPTPALKEALKPEFDVVTVSKRYDLPCGGPNQPQVVSIPSTINISICGYETYNIPVKTFYDLEQGYTRNLKLSLSKSSGESFDLQNVNFSSSTQTLIIIPKSLMLSSFGTNSKFLLTATDDSKLSVNTELVIRATGPFNILNECQIQVKLRKHMTTEFIQTNIETIMFVVGRLMMFFNISKDEIGIVDFYYIDDREFFFSWSYCSPLYETESYKTNDPTLPVDYHGLQKRILMKLYLYDRMTISSNFQNAFLSEFEVTDVKVIFSKRCQNLPPIVTIEPASITMTIGYGGYDSYLYREDIFFDFEDGWAYSLNITFLDSSGSRAVLIDNWVNVDITTHSIYAVVNDNIRSNPSKEFVYYLQATDRLDSSIKIPVNIKKTSEVLTFSPFNITYLLQYNGQLDLVYSNQSSSLVNHIKNFWSSISRNGHVLMRRFHQSSGSLQYRIITWSIHGHTCNSTVLEKIKNSYYRSGLLNPELVSSVGTMFSLKRVYYDTTCFDPGPIDSSHRLPTLNITFCTIYTYQVPLSLFYNQIQGEANTMELILLNDEDNPVSSSSWIQLNPATMEIYAVPIESIANLQRTETFKIKAVNSGGRTNTARFTTLTLKEPFTVDCKMTMTFQYRYVTSTVVYLDIVQSFMKQISSYYKDSTVKIKILDFIAYSNNTFDISWSNCSFIFETKQSSMLGLTENYRKAIKTIFSHIITDEGFIFFPFQQSIANLFTILRLSVNYDCIEEPPVAQVNEEIVVYARFCELFKKQIDKNTFIDKRDGDTRNLKLTLADVNGKPVPIDHWIQLDDTQNLYGIVTEEIKQQVGVDGFKYLLIATDTAGLSANVSYTIKIISPVILFDIYFRTGFTSTFSVIENTATILYRFLERLSKYIDVNDPIGKIYVKRFKYPSMIEWSHCSLKTCTSSKVNSIVNKLVSETGVIRPTFKEALQPEFIPVTTRVNVIKNGQCSSSNISVIAIQRPPNPTFSVCGYFTYNIRSDQFRDINQGNTKLFYLNLYDKNGKSLPLTSWIQFNETQQFIYGIPILTQITSHSTYILKAKHQTSGLSQSILSNITISDYNKINDVLSYLCFITFNVTAYYNPDFDDVTLLKVFMETLSMYLRETTNNIVISDYERHQGYPYHLVVTWTSCRLTSLFIKKQFDDKYYTDFVKILNQLLNLENNLYLKSKVEVKNFFESSSFFKVNSIQTNNNCLEPLNKPPRAKGDIVLNVTCGSFAYRIPDDTFDEELAHLTLTLLSSDNNPLQKTSWIYLNRSNVIKGMISNDTIQQATNNQHRFKLTATNLKGLSTTINVIITVPNKLLAKGAFRVDVTIVIQHMYQYNIIPKVNLIERLNTFIAVKTNLAAGVVNLFITSENILPFESKLIYVFTITNCNKCIDAINYYISSLQDYTLELIFLLTPEFEIHLIKSQTPDYELCIDVFNQEKIIERMVPYCNLWQLPVAAIESSYVDNNKVQIVFNLINDVKLPLDSWVWLNNKTLQAFPPESFWSAPISVKGFYQYHIVLPKWKTEARNLVISLNNSKVEPNAIEFKIRLSTFTERDPDQYNNYYINLVMKALVDMVGSGNGIHFLSYTELQRNPFLFEVKWKNCTLPSICDDTDMDLINSMLYSRNSLGRYRISEFLPANYVIEDIDNRCATKPPKLSFHSLNLSIPVCGLFKYQFNSTLATNNKKETLKDFSVNLLHDDGSPLDRSSWIRYNTSSMQIYAFPVEAISTVARTYQFILRITDKNDANVDLVLNVDIIKRNVVFYEISMTFENTFPVASPYLDMQIKMLELISLYNTGTTYLGNYRVQVFESVGQSSKLYYFKYADCSVKEKLCDSDLKQLKAVELNLFTETNQFQPRLNTFLKPFYFKGIKMQRETMTLNVDQPPMALRNLDSIILNECEAVCKDYLQYFYDNDQSKDSLMYVLQNEIDKALISSSHWAQLDGNRFCAYPGLKLIPGTYNYTIIAADKCGNTASVTVSVRIESNYEKDFGYKWSTTFSIDSSLVVNDVYYLSKVRENMFLYLKNTLRNSYGKNPLQIIAYAINGDKLEISFGDCSIQYRPCNESAVSILSSALLTNKNQPRPELLTFFEDVLKLTSISDTKQYPCGSQPDGPHCSSNKLVYNASACSEFRVKLPEICFDANDGGMESLNIDLKTESYMQLPKMSWIQYNKSSRSIYGYHIYKENNTNTPLQYKFILEIRDTDNNSAFIDIYINLIGEIFNRDYQLSLEGRIPDNHQLYMIDYQLCMLRNLKSYFQEGNIATIDYILPRPLEDPNFIKFVWIFCEVRHKPCDCKMIKRTQSLLVGQLETIRQRFKSCINVININYELIGECKKTNPPRLENGISVVVVTVGQVYRTILPNNQFVDDEDGSNENLTIVISNEKDKTVDIQELDWMTFNNNQICGLLTRYDFEKYDYKTENMYTYYITAIDSCGQSVSDEYKVRFTNNNMFLQYKLHFRILLNYHELIENCSKIENLILTITEYANVPVGSTYIDQISNDNSTNNTIYFVWATTKLVTFSCDSEEFKTFRKLFFNGEIRNEVFINYMSDNGYIIKDLNDYTTVNCDSVYPWWPIILLLTLVFTLLLIWILWLCIPRFCPLFCSTCCGRLCPCCIYCGSFCTTCCMKDGKWSSMRLSKMTLRKDISSSEVGNVPLISPSDKGEINSLIPLYEKDFTDRKVVLGDLQRNDALDGGGIYELKDSTDSKNANIHDQPLPLSVPLPIHLSYNKDLYQTERWHDEREPNIFAHKRKATTHESTDGHRHGYYESNTIDRKIGKNRENFKSYQNDSRNDEIQYQYNPTSVRQSANTASYIETHKKKTLVGRNTSHVSGEHKHVRVKQPVAVQIRRSELNEYLRTQGRKYGTDIQLNSYDVQNLLQGNAKISLSNIKENTGTRISNALVDKRITHNYNEDNYYRRRRSNSTSSLSDLLAVNEAGQQVVISPRNIKFRMKSYENPRHNISSHSSSDESCILLIEPNNSTDIETPTKPGDTSYLHDNSSIAPDRSFFPSAYPTSGREERMKYSHAKPSNYTSNIERRTRNNVFKHTFNN